MQKIKVQKDRQTGTLVLVREVTSLLQRTQLNITVTCQFLHAKNARHMLLDLIDFLEPTMAIVGSRGLGKLKGILLGSTSHYLVQKSSVPVMVSRLIDRADARSPDDDCTALFVRRTPLNSATRPVSVLPEQASKRLHRASRRTMLWIWPRKARIQRHRKRHRSRRVFVSSRTCVYNYYMYNHIALNIFIRSAVIIPWRMESMSKGRPTKAGCSNAALLSFRTLCRAGDARSWCSSPVIGSGKRATTTESVALA